MRITLLFLSAIVLTLASTVSAQTTPASQAEVAKVSTAGSTTNNNGTGLPVFTDYRGVRLGMSADEVKTKLKDLKGGTGQDFFVFSEREAVQIYYDENKKVIAISIDYIGDSTNAPSPRSVLGIELEAKPDGSMYQLNRYPEAGYWVSYNRTAGDKPIVTITMQKVDH